MKTISLKIDDDIFGETEKILALKTKSMNRYINEAIDHYNKLQKRTLLEKKLGQESDLVKEDSLEVLKEFEAMGYAD
jgi:predicted transcriptional regulator